MTTFKCFSISAKHLLLAVSATVMKNHYQHQHQQRFGFVCEPAQICARRSLQPSFKCLESAKEKPNKCFCLPNEYLFLKTRIHQKWSNGPDLLSAINRWLIYISKSVVKLWNEMGNDWNSALSAHIEQSFSPPLFLSRLSSFWLASETLFWWLIDRWGLLHR